MKTRRAPVIVIVIILLAILVGGYFGLQALLKKDVTALTASGSIETVEVSVSPEMGGKVTDVPVDEGDQVKAGQVLFQLDPTLLQAQQAVAATGLDAAQAAVASANAALAIAQSQYTLAVNTARTEAAGIRTSSWQATPPAGYTLPGWFFNQTEATSAAQAEVDTAKSDRDAAQAKLDTLENDSSAAGYRAAETRLNNARTAFQVADAVLTKAKTAQNNTDLQLSAQKSYDTAKTELDNAQTDYDDLKDQDVSKNILTGRADLVAAQERYETAQDNLLALQYGDQSPKLAAARASLEPDPGCGRPGGQSSPAGAGQPGLDRYADRQADRQGSLGWGDPDSQHPTGRSDPGRCGGFQPGPARQPDHYRLYPGRPVWAR